VAGGLGPTLFGGSLGGPISKVTSQKLRDWSYAFTKIYVFRVEVLGESPCIGERPGTPAPLLMGPCFVSS